LSCGEAPVVRVGARPILFYVYEALRLMVEGGYGRVEIRALGGSVSRAVDTALLLKRVASVDVEGVEIDSVEVFNPRERRFERKSRIRICVEKTGGPALGK